MSTLTIAVCGACGYRASTDYVAITDVCPSCQATPFPIIDEGVFDYATGLFSSERDAMELAEADPAEADPAEAEPSTPAGYGYWVKFKRDGMWTAAHYCLTLADALDAIHGSEYPAIIGLGIFTIHTNTAAHNLGIRTEPVCPVHGAECEAWVR